MMEMLNIDCMAYMATRKDKEFDLAIVDPEYGIDINMNMGRRKGMGIKHKEKEWDKHPPSKEYFNELFRISKNQIIWGGNYFSLPPTRGFIIWDKKIPEILSFSMCEFAWTSFDIVAKIYRKEIQCDTNNRIHPTQKPIRLYRWLLKNYAKAGDKIIDTHGGSFSSAIAVHQMNQQGMNLSFTGMEIDRDYYDAAIKRFNLVTSQKELFEVQK